jgi:hypothetical protein
MVDVPRDFVICICCTVVSGSDSERVQFERLQVRSHGFFVLGFRLELCTLLGQGERLAYLDVTES